MPAKKQIIKTVIDSILKYNMIKAGERIIVAVSGGPDSICLMDVLADLSAEMDIDLVIAHYEHGLRPGEDVHETDLVRRYADSRGLPFETEKAFGLSPVSSSLEEKARELRYDFLERTRQKFKAHKIAMGHNLNDQAETVLMRLLRGSGMTGLSGIPPVRDNTIIRPLIEIGREDIIAYLEYRNLEYATDSSNNDNRFLRNKMRLELLPELLKYQPGLVEILGRLSDNLRDENSFFESQTDRWVDENIKQDESGAHYIDIPLLNELPSAFVRRIIRNIVKRYNKTLYAIDSDHVEAIIDLTANEKPNIPIDLPGDLVVRKEYSRLIFTSQKTAPDGFFYEIREKGEYYIHEINRTLTIEEFTGEQQTLITSDADTAFLDNDLLPCPLIIRNSRPGDRFVPLGMTGKKKIKDFFIDQKIPPAIRKQTPILVKDNETVWVCGHRIDNRYKVTSNTKNILKITLS